MKVPFGASGGMSISARLHIGFGILLVMLCVVGGLSWFQTSKLAERGRQLVDEDVKRVVEANAMQISVQDMVVALGNLCRQRDPGDIQFNSEQFANELKNYQQIKKNLLAVPLHTDGAAWKKALQDMSGNEEGVLSLFEQMAKLSRDPNADAVMLQDFNATQVSGPQATLMDGLAQLRARMREAMAQASAESQANAKRSQFITLAILCVSLAGGLLSAVLISRSISRPLNRAVMLARTVAQGDLSAEVRSTQKDEIGALLNALADMQDALRHLVGDIRECADSIQVASSEVASGNTDLSQRTEHAAGNLQQTASSLEELTGAVRQSADSAATANQLASSASRAAHRGGEVVQQVVSSMADISTSSRKIGDIISVIDGIAFQTNLLALNAAVEAARAGEQGRGFAVVAGEVRNLAQRAATAAREIKTLIGASVERVESGTKLVQDAGSTMHEIVSAVQRVTDVIGEITAATAEQSSGIGQVNGAVVELDRMTQQNAALVEQSAAAAESLREQASRLNGLVGTFQLVRGELPDVASAPVEVPTLAVKVEPKAAAKPAPRPVAPKAAAAKPADTPAMAGGGASDNDWTDF